MGSETEISSAAIVEANARRAGVGIRDPSGWIEIDGHRLPWARVLPAAQGAIRSTVVCLHAAARGSAEFQPLAERLGRGAQLICFDWPNHGSAKTASLGAGTVMPTRPVDRQDYAGILDGVLAGLGRLDQHNGIGGLDRLFPILLGSGFGAEVAIRYAAAHPGETGGLILANPAGLIAPASRLRKAIVSRLRRHPVATRDADEASANAFHLQVEALRADFGLEQLPGAGSKAALSNDLATLTCPILFALSRDSIEYSVKRYLELLDPLLTRSPQHRFTVFRGEFSPIWDEPDRFAIAVQSFTQALLPLGLHTHAWLLTATDWPGRGLNLWKCVHPECPAEKTLTTGENANGPLR